MTFSIFFYVTIRKNQKAKTVICIFLIISQKIREIRWILRKLQSSKDFVILIMGHNTTEHWSSSQILHSYWSRWCRDIITKTRHSSGLGTSDNEYTDYSIWRKGFLSIAFSIYYIIVKIIWKKLLPVTSTACQEGIFAFISEILSCQARGA